MQIQHWITTQLSPTTTLAWIRPLVFGEQPITRNGNFLETVPAQGHFLDILRGTSATDVWIGGRSDPESKSSISRAVLETGGMLGRPTPWGTNKNGAPMQIQ